MSGTSVSQPSTHPAILSAAMPLPTVPPDAAVIAAIRRPTGVPGVLAYMERLFLEVPVPLVIRYAQDHRLAWPDMLAAYEFYASVVGVRRPALDAALHALVA